MDTIDRIVELLKEKGVSGAEMSRACGFSNAVFSQWKSHKQNPSATKIAKMAEYFGVTVGYLLGQESRNPAPADSANRVSDDDIKFALFNGADGITDDMYEEVKRFAQFIKEREGR